MLAHGGDEIPTVAQTARGCANLVNGPRARFT